MTTLDRWRGYLKRPRTIQFPAMRMRGMENLIASGRGQVHLTSSDDVTFLVDGRHRGEPDYVTAELERLRRAPQDENGHPRVSGTDAEGIEWSCHYVAPWLYQKHGTWTFGGQVVTLITHDRSATVAEEAGTELIILLRGATPLLLSLIYAVRSEPGADAVRGAYELNVLGSTVRFALETDDDLEATILRITVAASRELPLMYPETWLVQPFRIMFGELIHPSLIARNLGDGTAVVFMTRASEFVRNAYWATLWDRNYRIEDHDAFWSRYAHLLTMMARQRREDGSREATPKIARLYEELIQAGRGTHWGWAFAFASSIEAVAAMLASKNVELTQEEIDEVDSLVKHIKGWKGKNQLKENAIRAVRRTAEMTTVKWLRELQAQHVITKSQMDAWQRTRNSVMHGTLLSMYSSEEENERLQQLSAMMHALTREVLRRSVPESKDEQLTVGPESS